MILAALYTGQRLKDIASLTWSNVDLERDEFRFATSKTGRRQVIPIARPLRRHIETLPAGDNPSGPLFPTAFRIATVNRDTSALPQTTRRNPCRRWNAQSASENTTNLPASIGSSPNTSNAPSKCGKGCSDSQVNDARKRSWIYH
jgi:integrase